MSKLKLFSTLFLAVIALALIGYMRTDQTSEPPAIDYLDTSPNYEGQHMITLAYEPTGKLGYKLVADEVKYFSELKDVWFTKPVMTMYDDTITPVWVVSADRAKLTSSRLLYLYGNVEVNNLSPESHIQRISTDDAYINLITQDIVSDSQVSIYGPQLRSVGTQLRGNLRNKTAELIDNVSTTYVPNNNDSSGKP